MLDVIRDPAWQFAGAVLALIAVGVSLLVYFSQRARKRLFVETITRIPLVTSGAKGISGLEIKLNDRPISRAILLLVRIRNIGNRPILTTDFEEPVSIQFADNAVVLSADVGESTPSDLAARLIFTDRAVTIERQLLNPGDAFTCRILVENSKGEFTARARIAGVRQLERRSRTSLLQPLLGFASSIVTLGAWFLSPSPKSIGFADLRAEELPYLLIALVSMSVLFIVLSRDLISGLRTWRHRRRLFGSDDA